jgi:hypothetical protein
MSKYETYLEELENSTGISSEALESAADSLAFIQSLHTVFRENGYDLPEEPDVSALENILDSMMGELAAASIFLSEDSFMQVPHMLRTIAKAFEATAGGEEVPTVIVNGYNRLADRIQATRVQQQQMKDLVTAQNTK